MVPDIAPILADRGSNPWWKPWWYALPERTRAAGYDRIVGALV
jgi:hypothetical protein